MNYPSGTVTFLFTDIEGSTKLAQEYPNEMTALLARHHEILHQAIQAQNGYVFQIIGDAFCAAFHTASDALTAAMDAQRALQSETWNPAPIKVRMGIHTGTAQLTDENLYLGYATLASTQRIMSAGHGGQVLLSNITRELAGDGFPTDTEMIDLGEKRLKDLLRPERLYQLNISGLATTFPPLKTLDSFPNNLPVHLTSFIGRENEIDEVKQELEEHRLVTLTGSGGTGKTRLSLQVAAELIEKFDHGIWFVELAPITDPELVPQTILTAIGIKEQENKAPLELLKEYFQERQTLIVLDNCEHLVSASAQVVNELLRAAPRIKILASSREALGVRGEVSYPVPSLSLPNPKQFPTIEGISQYEAVRLFIDRALLANPRFEVDKDNAPFLAQICHRLDGIPLAIELAAARVKVLSVDQISKRLDDRFRLLTGGARTALPRQQTLRALIDWSYDLLEKNERLLLRRLSVFAGGWTLEAAEEVCSGDEIESFDVLDLLSQLVNKSLAVVMEGSQSGETRYRMLETIRQYARDKLLETGGGETVRDKHLVYFVKLTEQTEPELYRANQVFWMDKLDDELDNIRLAMEWAINTNTETGLQIAVAINEYSDIRGHTQEIGGWLTTLLKQHSKADTLHAYALEVYSHNLGVRGDMIEAKKTAHEGLDLSRAISNRNAEAWCLFRLGWVTNDKDLLEQSISLFQELGDKWGQARVIEVLAENTNLDREKSKALVIKALELHRELGNLFGIAHCNFLIAQRLIWSGDFSSAMPLLDESLEIHHQLGNPQGKGGAFICYGDIAYNQGNYQQASTYFQEAISLYEKIGVVFVDWPRTRLAYTLLRIGNVTQAKEMFGHCVKSFQKVGLTTGVVFSIEGLASVFGASNKPKVAALLIGWADAVREKIGDQRPPVEQDSVNKDLEIIHSQVDDATFEKLWEEGKKLTYEEAIKLALKELE